MSDTATFMQVDLPSLFYGAKSHEEFLERALIKKYGKKSDMYGNLKDKTSKPYEVPKVKVDFEKIWSYFSGRDAEFLTEAIMYMIKGQEFDNAKFEAKIKSIGYRTKVKNIVRVVKRDEIFFQQANHNIQIAVDCLDRLSTFNKWILFSGNGDFVDLCKYLRQKKKKIEIWSFKEGLSMNLVPYADHINIIGDEFLYKTPNVTVFGFSRDIT